MRAAEKCHPFISWKQKSRVSAASFNSLKILQTSVPSRLRIVDVGPYSAVRWVVAEALVP